MERWPCAAEVALSSCGLLNGSVEMHGVRD